MGKPIVSKKKPIQIDGEALVPVVVHSTGKKTIDPSVTAAAQARKKRVTFQDVMEMEAEADDEEQRDSRDVPHSETTTTVDDDNDGSSPSDTWLSRRELDQIRFRVRKEVSLRRILEETQTQSNSQRQDDPNNNNNNTYCWRGLETTQVTARLRKEHVQSVLRFAANSGMMAQFARQSSGSSGSTRAAYLRGLEDEQVAAKIHAEIKRAQSLW